MADALVFLWLVLLTAAGPAPREIRLVARDMTFYAEGRPDPNPSLSVRPGQTVRIVFRNTDVGMRHDFTIPEWGVATQAIKGRGETVVVFRAPERGSAHYNCTPHAAVMKGTIAVE